MNQKELIAALSKATDLRTAMSLGETLKEMMARKGRGLRGDDAVGKLLQTVMQTTDDDASQVKILGELRKVLAKQKGKGGSQEVLKVVSRARKTLVEFAGVKRELGGVNVPPTSPDVIPTALEIEASKNQMPPFELEPGVHRQAAVDAVRKMGQVGAPATAGLTAVVNEMASQAKKPPRITLSPNLAKATKMLGGVKGIGAMAAPMLLQAVLSWYLNRSLGQQQSEYATSQQYGQIQQALNPSAMGGNPMLDAQLQATQAALFQRQFGQPMKVSSEETI